MNNMKRKLLALVVLLTMVFALTACGANSENQDTSGSQKQNSSVENEEYSEDGASSDDGGNVVILDSGFSLNRSDSEIYAQCGIKFKNTSKTTTYEGTTITATAKDKDGGVIATEDQVMMTIQPEETQAVGILMSCNGETPKTIEFEIDNGNTTIPADGTIKSSEMKISGTKDRRSGGGESSFTGSIKNTSEKSSEDVMVTVLLYNGEKLVYACDTFVENLKAKGEKAFEVTEYDVPKYDSYEVIALDWDYHY